MEQPVKTFNSFYETGQVKNQNNESLSLRKSLIPPPDPLIERQIIPLNKPKFGKNFPTINLEQFDYKDMISENFILTKRAISVNKYNIGLSKEGDFKLLNVEISKKGISYKKEGNIIFF